MKILVLMFLVQCMAWGQTIITIPSDRVVQDPSIDSVCAQRGHIPSQYSTSTLMGTWDNVVDLPDRTLKIHYDYNRRSSTCQRCGKGIDLNPTPVDTFITWKSDPSQLEQLPDLTFKPSLFLMRVPEEMRLLRFDSSLVDGTFEKYIDSMQILGYTFVQVIDGKVLFRRKQ